MVYRNGTYVAFDGQATTNPTKSDMKYYGLLQKWNTNNNSGMIFSDSHKKTYQVRDTSSRLTLENRLMDRLRNSKNFLLILSDETNWDRGMLNFEIEKAVDKFQLPIIVAYTGYRSILNPSQHSSEWPKNLANRINNNTAKCIHIPFKKEAIVSAISQFSIHNTGDNKLTGPLHYYNKEVQKKWGYI